LVTASLAIRHAACTREENLAPTIAGAEVRTIDWRIALPNLQAHKGLLDTNRLLT